MMKDAIPVSQSSFVYDTERRKLNDRKRKLRQRNEGRGLGADAATDEHTGSKFCFHKGRIVPSYETLSSNSDTVIQLLLTYYLFIDKLVFSSGCHNFQYQ